MKRYCECCGKELTKKTQKKFCCASCSAKVGNKSRKITTKGRTRLRSCIRCGKEFYASIHLNAARCICEDCKKHNRPHHKEKKSIKTLKDISKKTFVKILKNMGAKCSICGWNESTCDVHHIIPSSEGGTDDFTNLIVVCPNCHRVCHTTNKYTKEFLSERNITLKYNNWMDFYHLSN